MIRNVRRLLAALVMALAFAGATAKDLPGDSVYLVNDTLSDQAGRSFTLAEGRGKPRLVAMFYTSCRYICPLIVDSAKGIEQALTPTERQRLGILLISLDPERDDSAALASVAAKRKLDPSRWTLARTETTGVRRIAAVLGVRYRALADGEFNHTSSLVLLDAEGRVVASTERLGAVPDQAFLAKVKALVAAPAQPPG
jgi:protein SCO1/2